MFTSAEVWVCIYFFKGEIVLWMPGKGQVWISKIDNRSTIQYT